ncbi:MAG: carboxypeptidase regulatory-like domain-containing protein [Chloracidobacterium sp.]|nr:carboxypeptidase regulatory-like domain-containing protein [Chloracidobacterium sp.]
MNRRPRFVIFVFGLIALATTTGTATGDRQFSYFDSVQQFLNKTNQTSSISRIWTTPDYVVTTTPTSITVTDLSGNNDTTSITQTNAGTDIKFTDSGTRTFSVNGGPVITGHSGDISLSGITSVTFNGANGHDTLTIASAVTGIIGMPSLTVNGGAGNDGVLVKGDVTFVSGAGLDLDIVDDGGPDPDDFITFESGAAVLLSGTGSAVIKATKYVQMDANSRLRTVDGDLTIEAALSDLNVTAPFIGVQLSSAVVEATGSGKVTVKGHGGRAVGSSNIGIQISGTGAKISGGKGPGVKTEVVGKGSLDVANASHGVFVGDLGSIASSGGDVLVTGTGGAGGPTGNFGVFVFGTGIITSGGVGALTVNGNGGSGPHTNYGVTLQLGAAIKSDGGGAVDVTGNGGSGGPGSLSVGVLLAESTITSGGGPVNVTGIGNTNNDGVLMSGSSGATLISSGGGPVKVEGTGAFGILLNSGGGPVKIGSGNNATITLIADKMLLNNGFNTSVDAGTGPVIIRPLTNGRAIDLGGADSATSLGLTDAEFDRVTAGTINVGNALTGAIGVSSNITRSTPTVINIKAGSAIGINTGSIDSAGGNVTATPGVGTSLFVSFGGVDFTTGAASTFKLASGRGLREFISSPTAYTQLNVAGRVDITGAILDFGSGSTATADAAYTIINNDGVDAIIGEFTGLPDEFVITNFLGSGLNAKIDYQGGDGNDCEIKVLANAATYSISGRVLSINGRAIRNGRVTVTGGMLSAPRTAISDKNGFYTVSGLASAGTYTVSVAQRRFSFVPPTRVITLNDNVAAADFVGSTGTNREQ